MTHLIVDIVAAGAAGALAGCTDHRGGISGAQSIGITLVDPFDRGAITQLAGRNLPRVVGVLRPIAIGSFHVWIMYPRSPADVTLPGPA